MAPAQHTYNTFIWSAFYGAAHLLPGLKFKLDAKHTSPCRAVWGEPGRRRKLQTLRAFNSRPMKTTTIALVECRKPSIFVADAQKWRRKCGRGTTSAFFRKRCGSAQSHHKKATCRGGGYGEVQRVVRSTDVVAGGGSNARNRRHVAEDSMQQAATVIQPGNAHNIALTQCSDHVDTKKTCSHGITAMSILC